MADADVTDDTVQIIRRRVTVIGPGAPGFLKARYRGTHAEVVVDVATDRVPTRLRRPNARFVGIFSARQLMAVEPCGDTWTGIQDQIREVLNRDWDPIGVADTVDDEYDGYIAGIHKLLRDRVADTPLVEHLRSIEVERMGLPESPTLRLAAVVWRLRGLELEDE